MRRQARTSSPSTAARAASTASIVPSRVSPVERRQRRRLAEAPRPVRKLHRDQRRLDDLGRAARDAEGLDQRDVERRGGQALDRGRGRHRRDPITRRLR